MEYLCVETAEKIWGNDINTSLKMHASVGKSVLSVLPHIAQYDLTLLIWLNMEI